MRSCACICVSVSIWMCSVCVCGIVSMWFRSVLPFQWVFTGITSFWCVNTRNLILSATLKDVIHWKCNKIVSQTHSICFIRQFSLIFDSIKPEYAFVSPCLCTIHKRNTNLNYMYTKSYAPSEINLNYWLWFILIFFTENLYACIVRRIYKRYCSHHILYAAYTKTQKPK